MRSLLVFAREATRHNFPGSGGKDASSSGVTFCEFIVAIFLRVNN